MSVTVTVSNQFTMPYVHYMWDNCFGVNLPKVGRF